MTVSVPEPGARRRRQTDVRPLHVRLARLAGLALAAPALLAAGCSGAGPTAPHSASASASASATASPRAPLSARILLPSRTVTAGSSMRGLVVVDNRTGHPVRAWGCLSLFQVILFSESYRPSPVWLTCLQSFIIPVGESSYPVTVGASYLGCGGGLPGCLNGRPPPLPPGIYRTRFFQSTRIVPAQPAITVRVTAP